MIGGVKSRLSQGVGSVLSSAVLFREASRTARQWQTYAARFTFSAVMLGVLLTGIHMSAAMQAFVDPADYGKLGRNLFVAFSIVQTFFVVLLAPLLVASGIIEESEERTIDLVVLTRLTPRQILGAKLGSRLLMLLTVVLGAMPVLAMVATLGGVSVIVVVSVTMHAVVTVAVLGFIGGFFGLFTRSPMLAALGAVLYILPTFIVFPLFYSMVAGGVDASAHFSPFAGWYARDPWVLLGFLSYAPMLAMTFLIGSRLFTLRSAHADLRRSFTAEVWSSWAWLVVSVSLLVIGLLTVPFASFTVWSVKSASPAMLVLRALCRLYIWGWSSLVVACGTWVFLRIGIDVVDAMDAIMGSSRRRTRKTQRFRVWWNPVLWREARPRAWGGSGLPLMTSWMLLLLFFLQTGWWLVPGGLLALGGLNIAGTLVIAIWLSTQTILRERQLGALEVLLTTTMPSTAILLGKMGGVALVTLPLILLSAPMLTFGVPHLALVDSWYAFGYGEAFVRGIATFLWVIPVWLLVILGSMMVAIRVSRPRSAFAISVSVTLAALGGPIFVGRLFPDLWLVAVPARMVAPPLAGAFTWWQWCFSVGCLVLGFASVFAVTVVRLRPWAGMAALLLAILPMQAGAQETVENPQDGFFVKARPLADGLVRHGDWAAVQVSLANAGPSARGEIALTERDGSEYVTFRRAIELPEKSRKEVLLLYKPGIRSGDREVVLTTTSGRSAVVPFKVRHITPDDVGIGVIGQDAMGLLAVTETWSGPVSGHHPRLPPEYAEVRKVRAGLIAPAAMPGSAHGLAGLDILVWPGADPTLLRPEQQRALRAWVADGGHLVVTVGENAKALAADGTLAPMLPVTLEGVVEVEHLDSLMEAFGGASPRPSIDGESQAPAVAANARVEAIDGRMIHVLERREDGRPAWVIGTYGLGTVNVLLTDPRVAPLSRVPRTKLWRRLLFLPPSEMTESRGEDWLSRAAQNAEVLFVPPEGGSSVQWVREGGEWASLSDALRLQKPEPASFYGGGPDRGFDNWESEDQETAWESGVRSVLSEIEGAEPIPMGWLIFFSGIYLLLIGPIDYLALRMLRRQPLTWITFPVTIVLFSAVALIGTSYTKGSQAILTRVEVIDLLPGAGLMRGQNYVGIFSTRKTTLNLRAGFPTGVVEPLRSRGFMNEESADTEFGASSFSWNAETWTLAYVKSSWVEPTEGTISLAFLPVTCAELREDCVDPIWEVRNNTEFDFVEAELVFGEGVYLNPLVGSYKLGPLKAGETQKIRLAARIQHAVFGDTGFAPEEESSSDHLWVLLHDQPDSGHGYMDLMGLRYSFIGRTETPVEPLELTGLSPVHTTQTWVRAPLSPKIQGSGQGGFPSAIPPTPSREDF